MVFSHLSSAFLCERDRGRGLNEIGHSFLCNKGPVHVRTWRRRSGNFAKLQYKTRYKVNEIRSSGLKLPHKAQVINESRRSYRDLAHHPYLPLVDGLNELSLQWEILQLSLVLISSDVPGMHNPGPIGTYKPIRTLLSDFKRLYLGDISTNYSLLAVTSKRQVGQIEPSLRPETP